MAEFLGSFGRPNVQSCEAQSRPGILDKSLFWNILGPFFFLSTLIPTRRKGRATSNTRQRRHVSRFVLPHAYARGHVADAVALGWIVE